MSDTPVGAPPLRDQLDQLGFVQLDSIRVVARAHHHILWSRDQTYRRRDLNGFAFKRRGAFEHFGHDASLFPMATYPKWTRRFRQFRKKLDGKMWYKNPPDATTLARIKERIAEDGPMCSADFPPSPKASNEMWARPQHKIALDHLWYAGELTTCHRVGFRKYYDLTERVIPQSVREAEWDDERQINWLCHAALSRLGFGTAGDISRFWDAVSIAEVKAWLTAKAGQVSEVEIESHDGGVTRAYMLNSRIEGLDTLSRPTSRLRILNPFDPAMRDRKRLKLLFGFEYVNEIFVPEAKRRWGYYVYPVLEGDRMVGRIDLSNAAKSGPLEPYQLWVEDGVKWTRARQTRLNAELIRLARLRE